MSCRNFASSLVLSLVVLMLMLGVFSESAYGGQIMDMAMENTAADSIGANPYTPGDGSLAFNYVGDFPTWVHSGNYALEVHGSSPGIDYSQTISTGQFSISLWLGHETVVGGSDIVVFDSKVQFCEDNGGKLQIWIDFDVQGWVTIESSNVCLGDSSDFDHIVATYDADNLRLYVNGVLVGSQSNLNESAPTITNVKVGIQGWLPPMLGAYDDVKIFDHGLSQAEVTALYGGILLPNVYIIETNNSTDVAEEGPTSDTYAIVLGTQPDYNVTVTIDPDAQTQVNDNGAGNTDTLTFTTSNWDTVQTVTVKAIDDSDQEGTHSSTITHTAVSSDTDYNNISITNVEVTITDDDILIIPIDNTVGSPDNGDSIVIFNEIMYHPEPGTDQTLEWVELYNQMAVDVDMSRWILRGGIDFDFPQGTVVDGDGFLLLVSFDPETEPARMVEFEAAYGTIPGSTVVVGPFTGQLDNGGEELRLRDVSSRLMDVIDYRDGGDWPVAPDGSGVHLPSWSCTIAVRRPQVGVGANKQAAHQVHTIFLLATRSNLPLTKLSLLGYRISGMS